MQTSTVHKHVEVQYDDAKHRYYLNNQTYTSATQLIEKFKNHFDTEERSQWMSHRYGNTPEYWRNKWKVENSTSLVRGNKIHNREEKKLYSKGYDLLPYPVPVQERISDPVYYNLPDGVYPEMKLWRHDCRIAGRTDKAIIRTLPYRRGIDPIDRVMDIDDYKTNKKLRTESFQNSRGEYTMMLGPLSHLMDCEMVHYTLQLSLYQYMGEYHGFLPGKRRIIHYPHPIPGVKACGPKIHQLPYLRNEVIAMINGNQN